MKTKAHENWGNAKPTKNMPQGRFVIFLNFLCTLLFLTSSFLLSNEPTWTILTDQHVKILKKIPSTSSLWQWLVRTVSQWVDFFSDNWADFPGLFFCAYYDFFSDIKRVQYQTRFPRFIIIFRNLRWSITLGSQSPRRRATICIQKSCLANLVESPRYKMPVFQSVFLNWPIGEILTKIENIFQPVGQWPKWFVGWKNYRSKISLNCPFNFLFYCFL